MLSFKIEDCFLNLVFISNSIDVIDKISMFFDAHRHLKDHDLSKPNEKVFFIDKRADNRYSIRLEDTVKICENFNNLLGVLVTSLYGSLPTDEFFYLHGGEVSKEDTCIALLAPSNMGKTTIVMGMLENGFCYRSDDIIPICKINSKSYCFPKPVFLRDDSPYNNYSNLTIINGDYKRRIWFPDNIDYIPRKLSAVFLLNRDVKFAKIPLVKKLYGVEKIKTILYNIYKVANPQEAISCTTSLLRSVQVYRLEYYNTSQAICLINQTIESEKSV